MGGTCATYFYREMDAAADMDFPVAIGTNGTLTVWLNGAKLFTNDTYKPESTPLTLKLTKGKNTLMVKACDTVGNHAFRFTLGHGGGSAGPAGPWFADVSDAWGLGENGLGRTEFFLKLVPQEFLPTRQVGGNDIW